MYLDERKVVRGGRSAVMLFDLKLLHIGKGTIKINLTTSTIMGKNSADEAIPPHFRLQKNPQTAETQQTRNELIEFIPDVIGKSGHDVKKLGPSIFGMNAKSGMDEG